jgi:hypothetical protein
MKRRKWKLLTFMEKKQLRNILKPVKHEAFNATQSH